MTDEEFIEIFNTYYQYSRYIMQHPKPLGDRYGDMFVTEIFSPKVEPTAIFDKNGSFIGFSKINKEDIYIKLSTPGGYEVRMCYFDFTDHIREDIRSNIRKDFGLYEWECLYTDHEDREGLEKVIKTQRELIERKYNIVI